MTCECTAETKAFPGASGHSWSFVCKLSPKLSLKLSLIWMTLGNMINVIVTPSLRDRFRGSDTWKDLWDAYWAGVPEHNTTSTLLKIITELSPNIAPPECGIGCLLQPQCLCCQNVIILWMWQSSEAYSRALLVFWWKFVFSWKLSPNICLVGGVKNSNFPEMFSRMIRRV